MQSKWMLRSLIAAAGITAATGVQAALISLDSVYGRDSITLDSDTGLEWIDPWLPIIQGNSGCGYGCTGASVINSYNAIKGMIGEGGYFEGFRYATRSDLDTLFYSSAGFDPITSSASSTTTLSDKVAAGYLQSFLDSTYGWGNDPNYWSAVTHAYFDDENPDTPVGAAYFFSGVQLGHLVGGTIYFYSDTRPESNSEPFGHFLVRDSAIKVSEPAGLSLLAFSMLGFASMLRRKG
ncbi:MAG TPA: hypothetical protein VM553_18875 [Dongiaceae bacterium]|nr:hypothetical protein [Dongiaceae bacterium]